LAVASVECGRIADPLGFTREETLAVRRTCRGELRRKRRVGPSAADKRREDRIVENLNRKDLAAGRVRFDEDGKKPLRCEAELERWLASCTPTFKPSTEMEATRIVRKHLIPCFGSKDLRELSETDLLDFIRTKLDARLAPKTRIPGAPGRDRTCEPLLRRWKRHRGVTPACVSWLARP
jgi:hypothetical protein